MCLIPCVLVIVKDFVDVCYACNAVAGLFCWTTCIIARCVFRHRIHKGRCCVVRGQPCTVKVQDWLAFGYRTSQPCTFTVQGWLALYPKGTELGCGSMYTAFARCHHTSDKTNTNPNSKAWTLNDTESPPWALNDTESAALTVKCNFNGINRKLLMTPEYNVQWIT